MTAIDELRFLYGEGRLLPFVGAGVSMSVEWEVGGERRRGVSWRDFVDEAIRQLGFDDPDLLRVRGDDIQILEYYRALKGDLAQLRNWLLTAMAPDDTALAQSPIHQALAALNRCRSFYTTNYDDFLERSFRLLGRDCEVVATEQQIAVSARTRLDDPSRSEIVKFHGDLNHPDEMIVCEADYYERLRLDDEMDYRLRSDILGRAILFVGYSFRDWNVAYLFNLANLTFGDLPETEHGRRAYIVVPDPGNFEYRLFRERKITVIPIDGRSLTKEIADLLGAIGAAP